MNRPALRACPPDAGLPDLAQRRVLLQRALERAQFAVGLGGREDLLLHQVGPLTAEAVQLDDEPTDIAELELAHLPEVAGPAAHLGAFGQSWTHVGSIGAGLVRAGRSPPASPGHRGAPPTAG